MPSDEYCEECGRTPCAFHDDHTEEPPVYDRPLQRYIGTVSFTVGLANKQYGGPEEGGWYYSTFHPIRVFHIPRRLFSRFAGRLERWCLHMNRLEKRYPPSSVLCHGWWTLMHGSVTTDQPEERPYYD